MCVCVPSHLMCPSIPASTPTFGKLEPLVGELQYLHPLQVWSLVKDRADKKERIEGFNVKS